MEYMDKFYCLIRVIKKKRIELYCFRRLNNIDDNSFIYTYPICFTANSFKTITYLFNLHNIINMLSINHILYLGKELFKAELSLFSHQIYIQE
uniref:DUF4346 domain-containing protein n=1 Tax=Dasya binghamiae TaxID=1896963 RepID=A0A1C8XS97_9FLOR|nr:hypothetical protein BI108_pgp037 [Dasya binghamiae]AOH77370.1 hypothetical protein [Dasya binghamiae]